MTERGTSLSLTPGFQTAFRIRAVPRASLSLDPKDSFAIEEVESQIDLEGTCEYLPDQVACQVTWLVSRGGGEIEEFGGYSCKLDVSGTTAKVTLTIDPVALDLVGTGTVGVELAPDFPYCEPSRVEPGPWGFDNKAGVSLSKTKGCKIGTVLTLTPNTSGAYASGALKLDLSESDEGERGGGEGQLHTIYWPDGDRAPKKWRIGCTSPEGPPSFDYREFGECGSLEFGGTLFHGPPESANEDCVDPVWKRVWHDGLLVENVPFPTLESFEVEEGFLFGRTVEGKISGFEEGLEVPLWIGAAIRKWNDPQARWHPIPVSLEDDGSFEADFSFPPGWEHVDDLYGMSCGAIGSSEAFAAVIDYDTALVSPAAGGVDEVPPRSADKSTGGFVVLGHPAAGVFTSSTGRKDLNDEVIAKAETKSGGTYKWAKGGHGCPATITHKGKQVLKRNPDGSTYCCGYTLWVMLEVAGANGLLDGLSAQELINLRSQWFGAVRNEVIKKKQPAAALKNFGLGQEIPFLQAKRGDFTQLWRTSGSGHSVIFLNWIKDEAGTKIGIRYRASNSGVGITEREEKFNGQGGKVEPSQCYAGRLMAKVSRPPQVIKGALRFFRKSSEGKKTYVEHEDVGTRKRKGTKVFAEVGGKADDFPFASVTTYGKTRAGITSANNGKDRPRLSPSEVSGSRLKVAAAVSNNEGSFVDVQAYDDSYLTHGTGQWTQKSGNLAKLLQEYKTKKPSLFAKYFEDRQVELQEGKIWIDDEQLGETETSLHLAYCLWQSGYDAELQKIQIDFLADRIKKFYPSHSQFGDLGKYYTSERSIAHLLDLHVNRPAYVDNVAKKAVEAYLEANPTKKDPSKWSEADENSLVEQLLAIRHTYKSGKGSAMTHSKERAKKIKAFSELSTKRNSYQG